MTDRCSRSVSSDVVAAVRDLARRTNGVTDTEIERQFRLTPRTAKAARQAAKLKRRRGTGGTRCGKAVYAEDAVPGTTLFPAKNLQPGDLVSQEPYSKHVVEIINKPEKAKDRFGAKTLRFRSRIVSGPDRIGEEGLMTYGPDGVVRKVISTTKTGSRLKPGATTELKRDGSRWVLSIVAPPGGYPAKIHVRKFRTKRSALAIKHAIDTGAVERKGLETFVADELRGSEDKATTIKYVLNWLHIQLSAAVREPPLWYSDFQREQADKYGAPAPETSTPRLPQPATKPKPRQISKSERAQRDAEDLARAIFEQLEREGGPSIVISEAIADEVVKQAKMRGTNVYDYDSVGEYIQRDQLPDGVVDLRGLPDAKTEPEYANIVSRLLRGAKGRPIILITGEGTFPISTARQWKAQYG